MSIAIGVVAVVLFVAEVSAAMFTKNHNEDCYRRNAALFLIVVAICFHG